ncbi:hypothetical protein Mapa_014926 [Marchantia paleacea]|nr:hypothetical protein Mapa_014926 [Marchantia paleacea]
MVPHPSVLHISAMVTLAEHLVRVSRGGIRVTILSFEKLIYPLVQKLKNLSPDVYLHGLVCTLKSGELSVDKSIERLEQAAEHYVQTCVERKKAGHQDVPSFLLSDCLQVWTTKISTHLNIPRFVMANISACSIALALASGEVRGHERITLAQACEETKFDNLPLLTSDETGMKNKKLLQDVELSVKHAAGIVINTFEELEADALHSIRQLIPDSNVLAIGPCETSVQIIKWDSIRHREVDAKCMDYLKNQPKKSVVYINFGKSGMIELSKRHIYELAHGLEASGEPFLWILPLPPSVEEDDMLPEGFEVRNKDRGLVVRGWVTQQDILSHPSTGVFLMHCGWNSCLESISRGVPIIAWPSLGDQLHNSRYLAHKAKVAILLPQEDGFLVSRTYIEQAIKISFTSEEGMQLKERAMELKATSMIIFDEGGSSYKNLDRLIKVIRS